MPAQQTACRNQTNLPLYQLLAIPRRHQDGARHLGPILFHNKSFGERNLSILIARWQELGAWETRLAPETAVVCFRDWFNSFTPRYPTPLQSICNDFSMKSPSYQVLHCTQLFRAGIAAGVRPVQQDHRCRLAVVHAHASTARNYEMMRCAACFVRDGAR